MTIFALEQCVENGVDLNISDAESALAELNTLRTQLAEAQKDSERLDWIEQSWFYRDSRGTISFVFNDSWDAGTHDSLRAAIDTAKGEP